MEEDRSQDRNPHFVRACGVETHVKISQEEFLYGNSQPKCRSPKPRRRFVAKVGQSKRMSRFHKSHFIHKFTGKMPRPKAAAHALCEPARSKCTATCQEPLFTEIYRKNAVHQIEPRTRTHILCESAQSKCTSTFHQSHFIQKFTGKMPRPKTTAHTLCEPAQSKRMSHVKISREQFYTKKCRKNAQDESEHPDQAPASTPTVRTPQCRHIVWG